MQIGFVCPTHKALDLHSYTAKAIITFLKTTPNGIVVVVDDGSVGFSSAYTRKLKELSPDPARIVVEHFKQPLGLTRSWNRGLEICADQQVDYAIAGNNDVVFPVRWYEGLVQLAEVAFAMVGPLSNAPGVTAKGQQEISKFIGDYTLTDDPVLLDNYSLELLKRYKGHYTISKVNGFFQFAAMRAWIAGRYDAKHFYRPANFFTAAGVKNPTPYTTLNEDELQSRWEKLGMKSAVCRSSFIFHYRAVTRGDKYKKGQWYRQDD
jgi:GT2 family glycosyltransferase